ncbi:hypothetical protein EWU23_00250 [Cytophagaceae bacterium 50C-KIRBA]|uniref:Uncharacterized protein n=1 Tax=Aquirufa beregesia TaxID=2516556 RepID=A0ABX0EZ37_9BACT|nr:hypothetical protein [Aquirufa beregesia]
MEIIPTIEKYLNGITTDEFHRYKSWDNCHQSFSVSNQKDSHILELAFYLASWGMYRGSSGLLQKNHLIHKGAVDILFSNKGQKLKCNSIKEVNKSNIKDILILKDILSNHYKNIKFTKGADKPKPISPTDTLLSKILLGTLSCVPAYDKYFINGLKEKKIKNTAFNYNSLNELFDFINNHTTEIDNAQKLILKKTEQHYPVMKILDMYFWQIGYDKEVKNKQKI